MLGSPGIRASLFFYPKPGKSRCRQQTAHIVHQPCRLIPGLILVVGHTYNSTTSVKNDKTPLAGGLSDEAAPPCGTLRRSYQPWLKPSSSYRRKATSFARQRGFTGPIQILTRPGAARLGRHGNAVTPGLDALEPCSHC